MSLERRFSGTEMSVFLSENKEELARGKMLVPARFRADSHVVCLEKQQMNQLMSTRSRKVEIDK